MVLFEVVVRLELLSMPFSKWRTSFVTATLPVYFPY